MRAPWPAGPDGTLWNEATIGEFDRLIEKTGSMRFIPAHEKPADRSAPYYNPRVRIKLKEGKPVRRVRDTVDGDRIDYPGAVSANAAELTTIKLFLTLGLVLPGLSELSDSSRL
jgi:hypothetical protein